MDKPPIILHPHARVARAPVVSHSVVGDVLNFAVCSGLYTLFPEKGVFNWFAVVVRLVAFLRMGRWKCDVVPTVLGSGAPPGRLYHLTLQSLPEAL